MKPKRICPLCGNNDVYKIHSFHYLYNYEINGLPENVDLVFCNNCNIIYDDFEASQKEFDIYYSNMSLYNEKHCDINFRNKQYYENIIESLKKYININSSILDIGCGTGNFLKLFYNAGYKNLNGIDQSNAFDNVKNMYNINFINGSIFSNIPEKKYDVITLNSLIEHIVDLQPFLIKIKNLLNDNGILSIDIPDIKTYKKISCSSIEHVNHFSIDSIMYMARKYNYDILEIRRETILEHCDKLGFILQNKNDIKLDIINNMTLFIKKIFNDINIDLINYLVANNTKVILWGIANTILPILPKLKDLNIIQIVDTSYKKIGKRIFEKQITSPNNITDEEATILILPDLYYNNIYNQIKEMGLKNKVEFLTKTRPDQTRPDQTRPDQTRPNIYICSDYICSYNNTKYKKLQPMLQYKIAA